MKAYIVPNLDKTNCEEYTRETCRILLGCGIEPLMGKNLAEIFGSEAGVSFLSREDCLELCDIMIAVGGDGTILKCARSAAEHRKPVLGINCGRLGFMASLEHSQLGLLKRLSEDSFTLSRRMMIEALVKDKDGNEVNHRALNDIVISRADDCKIADFEVLKEDRRVSYLRANGVIFSTATGATAYSMSAGGPLIEPEMECIEFTQICPHSLFARSMIFSADSRLRVRVHISGGAHVCLNVDGNDVHRLCDGEEVEIVRSGSYIDIIDICGGSFFSSVNGKLMRPLKAPAEDQR
ncbi:MAG: NAD(+)/NADH kinase [Ruminococcus sp.]|nr:NAD(+)/NADH kinase [Ruminococcus sp.]